jgi:predicted hydrocarbon binding protein
MDYFSLEEIFGADGHPDTPGAQLYLYRLLQMLASRESRGNGPLDLSYEGAKRLVARLGLNSPERLVSLFGELGLGVLDLDIGANKIRAALTPAALPFSAVKSHESVNPGGCELERGLIDGMLEVYTGIPVTTI